MPPTQLFGPFELIQRISVGGMAEVFQARHRQSGAVVALKRILPNVSEDEDFIELFHDEARIATLLEHPNIARTVDAGQVDGGHYIALEFVDGKPLRTLIDRAAASGQVLPVELALFVIAGVTAGLAYAHDRRDAQGRPLLRQVRLGPVAGDRVEILSGVAPGEAVVLDPLAVGSAK